MSISVTYKMEEHAHIFSESNINFTVFRVDHLLSDVTRSDQCRSVALDSFCWLVMKTAICDKTYIAVSLSQKFPGRSLRISLI